MKKLASILAALLFAVVINAQQSPKIDSIIVKGVVVSDTTNAVVLIMNKNGTVGHKKGFLVSTYFVDLATNQPNLLANAVYDEKWAAVPTEELYDVKKLPKKQ
jgi:hypothetical protein